MMGEGDIPASSGPWSSLKPAFSSPVNKSLSRRAISSVASTCMRLSMALGILMNIISASSVGGLLLHKDLQPFLA